MNDPHVDCLFYRVVVPGVDTSEVERLEVALEDFECELDGQRMVARPTEHYPDIASARDALEPRLAAWEAHAELRRDVPLEFRFEGAEVIDREPLKPLPEVRSTLRLSEGAALLVSGTWGLPAFPDPPTHFDENDLVYVLRRRFRDVREGRERLLVCSQWFLTELQTRYGGRTKAAKALGVSRKVLNKLGELGERNDPRHGRKVKGPECPLTADEFAWVEAALREITLKAGEREETPTLTLELLPPLP